MGINYELNGHELFVICWTTALLMHIIIILFVAGIYLYYRLGPRLGPYVTCGREVRLNLSFVAKNYLYFFPERCDHKK